MTSLARVVRRRTTRAVVAALVLVAACSRNNPETGADFEPRPEPITVHVKNENFLDVNVSVIAGGVTRRLGQVSGNSSGDFTISASIANGQPVSISAVPIGQSARYTSPGLQVRPGQLIDVRIAASLRQSVSVVRDP